jgi:glycosyltransferase involved in cell wall biosynthesis
MHVVWINALAHGKGGAERYVGETAARLRERGVRSTLLYDAASPVDPRYIALFDGAYPEVDRPWQLRELAPDAVYVHHLSEGSAVRGLASDHVPVLRFFHDHKLFCLREHKYTAIGQRTCSRTVGFNCYSCLGFAQRRRSFPPVRLVSVARLRREQRQNHDLTAYVVGSTYMREHVAAHGFDRSKIHVLPLYTEAPSPVTGVLRERDLVLFVGQLVRGKGVDLLLRAIARTRTRARLIIAGQGNQEDELKELSSSLDLGARVEFAGDVGKERLAHLRSRARCLAMPSRAPETFGLAGLEALSSGLPVIASDVGGLREWLEDGGNGIAVPSGDVDALARAIDRLSADDALARAMGERGLCTHRERFLPEHHIGRLHGLLLQLIGGKAA